MSMPEDFLKQLVGQGDGQGDGQDLDSLIAARRRAMRGDGESENLDSLIAARRSSLSVLPGEQKPLTKDQGDLLAKSIESSFSAPPERRAPRGRSALDVLQSQESGAGVGPNAGGPRTRPQLSHEPLSSRLVRGFEPLMQWAEGSNRQHPTSEMVTPEVPARKPATEGPKQDKSQPPIPELQVPDIPTHAGAQERPDVTAAVPKANRGPGRVKPGGPQTGTAATLASVFTAALTPGGLSDENMRGILEHANPNVAGRELPGGYHVGDLLGMAAVIGAGTKEATKLHVLGKAIAGAGATVLPRVLSAPFVGYVADLIAEKAGVGKEVAAKVASRVAGAFDGMVRGATEGAIYGALNNTIEGEDVSPDEMKAYAVGAGILGMLAGAAATGRTRPTGDAAGGEPSVAPGGRGQKFAYDPYDVLGISKDATPAEVNRAWKERMKEFHPAANRGDPMATAITQQYNMAHDAITRSETPEQAAQMFRRSMGSSEPVTPPKAGGEAKGEPKKGSAKEEPKKGAPEAAAEPTVTSTVTPEEAPKERRGAGMRRRVADFIHPERRAEMAAKQAELQQAYRDPMTDLPNPAAFEKARPNLDSDPGKTSVVFDLTNSKAINDDPNLGWDVGNQRRADVAQILKEEAQKRGIDQRDVFRAGGDEFVVYGDPKALDGLGKDVSARVPDMPAGNTVSGIRFGEGPDYGRAEADAQAKKGQETAPRYRDTKAKPTGQVAPEQPGGGQTAVDWMAGTDASMGGDQGGRPPAGGGGEDQAPQESPSDRARRIAKDHGTMVPVENALSWGVDPEIVAKNADNPGELNRLAQERTDAELSDAAAKRLPVSDQIRKFTGDRPEQEAFWKGLADRGATDKEILAAVAPEVAPGIGSGRGMVTEGVDVHITGGKRPVMEVNGEKLKGKKLAAALRDAWNIPEPKPPTEVPAEPPKKASEQPDFKQHVAELQAQRDARESAVRQAIGPDGGEVEGQNGYRYVISRNPDAETKGEHPWRVTTIAPDGTPAGHTVHKMLDDPEHGGSPAYPRGAVQIVAAEARPAPEDSGGQPTPTQNRPAAQPPESPGQAPEAQRPAATSEPAKRDVREPAAPETTTDLFGKTETVGPEQPPLFEQAPSRTLAENEDDARAIVSSLEGKVKRGDASPEEEDSYKQALAMLRRNEAMSAEEVALRAEGEPGRDKMVDDIFTPAEVPQDNRKSYRDLVRRFTEEYKGLNDDELQERFDKLRRGRLRTSTDATASFIEDAARDLNTWGDVVSGTGGSEYGRRARGRDTQQRARIHAIEQIADGRGVTLSKGDPFLDVGRGSVFEENKDLVGAGGANLRSMTDAELEKEIQDTYAKWLDNQSNTALNERMGVLYAEADRPGREVDMDKVFGGTGDSVREQAANYILRPIEGEWYSRLERAIEKGPKKATGDAWLGYLNPGKRGFSKAEMEWAGLRDFLRRNPGEHFTRDDVLRYARKRAIRLQESKRSEKLIDSMAIAKEFGDACDATKEALRKVADAMQAAGYSEEEIARERGRWMPPGRMLPPSENEQRAEREAGRKLSEAIAQDGDLGFDTNGEATIVAKSAIIRTGNLDGFDPSLRTRQAAQEYAEAWAKLSEHWDNPSPPAVEAALEEWKKAYEKRGVLHRAYDEAKQRTAPDFGVYTQPGGSNYREIIVTLSREGSGHSDYIGPHMREPNAAVHLRMTDRAAKSGMVAFVEEEQSDWAQEARKRGGFDTAYVPPMPYGQTNDWVSLGLRRALLEAANGGYQYLGFVNGQQASDLYDLRTMVKRIRLGPEDEGEHEVEVFTKKGGSYSYYVEGFDELAENIGKGPATKLWNSEPDAGGARVASGDELRFDSRGMKNFYDEIVPKALTRELRALGVEQNIEKLDIPSLSVRGPDGKFAGSNMAVKLTPELRKAILDQGMRVMDRWNSKRSADEHTQLSFGFAEMEAEAARGVVRVAGRFTETPDGPLNAATREQLVAAMDGAQKAWVNIAGHTIKSGADAHRLLAPFFRSKQVEVLHLILTDADGRVIENHAITSGAIDYVALARSFPVKLNSHILRTGAKQVKMVHNHPSADPTPSTEDIMLDEEIRKRLPPGTKLQSYVIDDDTYGEVNPADRYVAYENRTRDRVHKVPGAKKDPEVGPYIGTPDAAAAVMAPHHDPNKVAVLYLDTRHRSVALEIHTHDAMRDARDWLPDRVHALGAHGVIVGVNDGAVGMAKKLQRDQLTGNEPGGVIDVVETRTRGSSARERIRDWSRQAPEAVRIGQPVPGSPGQAGPTGPVQGQGPARAREVTPPDWPSWPTSATLDTRVRWVADQAGMDADEARVLLQAAKDGQSPTDAITAIRDARPEVLKKLEDAGLKEQYLTAVRGQPRGEHPPEAPVSPDVELARHLSMAEGPFDSMAQLREFANAEMGANWWVDRRPDGLYLVGDDSGWGSKRVKRPAKARLARARKLLEDGADTWGSAPSAREEPGAYDPTSAETQAESGEESGVVGVPEIRPIPEPTRLMPEYVEGDYTEAGNALVRALPRHARYRKAKAGRNAERWEKKFTEEQLEDAGAYVEGVGNIRTGKSDVEVQSDVQGDPKNLARVVEDYRKVQEEGRKTLNKFAHDMHGPEYVKFLEDYLPHFYTAPRSKMQAFARRWARKVPSAAQRRIPTLADAVEAGLTPVTQNIATLHRMWAEVNWKGALNQRFVYELAHIMNDEGNPVIMKRGQAPPDWIYVDHPAIQKVYARKGEDGELHLWHGGAQVDPEVFNALRQVFDQPLSWSLVRAAETINAFAKKSALSFSFFHHFALTESANAALARSWNPVRGLALVEKGLRGGFELGGGLRLTTPHKEGLRLLNSDDFLRDVTLHGLNVDPIPDVMAGRVMRALRNAEARTRNIPVLNTFARAFRRFNEGWDKRLWNHYYTGLKAYTYYDIVAELMQKMPDTAKPDEVRRVKETVAKLVNDMFGGQEWDAKFWITPPGRQLAHLGILSPDWTLSNIQVAGRYVISQGGRLLPPPREKPEGKLARAYKTAKEQDDPAVRHVLGRYWRNMLLGVAALLMGTNRLLNGRWPWEMEPGHRLDIDVTPIMHAVAKVVPDWLPDWVPGAAPTDAEDKRRYYIKPAKQVREIIRYFTDPVTMAGAKLSPIVQAAVEQLTGSEPGQNGWDMPWKEDEMGWYESLPSRAAALMEKFQPFAFRGNNFALTFPLSRGMSWYKAQKAYEDIISAQVDPNLYQRYMPFHDVVRLKDEIDRAAKENGLDPAEQYLQANIKVRTTYYAKMWEAVEKKDWDSADGYGAILLKLGANDRSIRASGGRRGVTDEDIERIIRAMPGRHLRPPRPSRKRRERREN